MDSVLSGARWGRAANTLSPSKFVCLKLTLDFLSCIVHIFRVFGSDSACPAEQNSFTALRPEEHTGESGPLFASNGPLSGLLQTTYWKHDSQHYAL